MNDAGTSTDDQTAKKAENKKSLWPFLFFIYSPFLLLPFIFQVDPKIAILVSSILFFVSALLCIPAYFIFRISKRRAIACSLPPIFIWLIMATIIPSAFSYRDRAFCAYTEQDAESTLMALDSYFSKYGRMEIPTVAVLRTEENLILYNADDFISINPGPGTEVSPATIIQVTVTDQSGRCDKGCTYTLTTSNDKGLWKE